MDLKRDLKRLTIWMGMGLVLLAVVACSAPTLAGEIAYRSVSDEDLEPLRDDEITGENLLVFESTDARPLSRVEFLLNGVEVEALAVPADPIGPMAVQVDVSQLFPGRHEVEVVAFDEQGDRIPGSVRAPFRVQRGSATVTSHTPRANGPTLEGDESFRPGALSQTMARWYQRLWAAIRDGDDELAESGSLREYGYALQQHMSFLFTALRATGDLAFLDELARIGDLMASNLTTTWIDPDTGEAYEPPDGTEGLRRWLYLWDDQDDSPTYGTDTNDVAAYKAHAIVAQLAFALHANRTADSPGGVDYGSKADFWTTYLISDFERIQHIRRGTEPPADVFRDLETEGMSVVHSMLTYHTYMHRLTGENAREEHASRYADLVARGMWTVDTPVGDAIVFTKPREPSNGLVPIVYARYTYALHVDLALEGHDRFGEETYMAMHARALGRFVMDNGSDDFAFDVGGMEDREGVNVADPTKRMTLRTQNPYDDSGLAWGRESPARFAISYLTPLAAFADSQTRERILGISARVYEDVEDDPLRPDRLAIPAGMLLAAFTAPS